MIFVTRIIVVLSLLLFPMACAHENLNESLVSEPHVQERWLSYLEDGKTKRNEIVQRLGEATSGYQDNRVLGYRLILIEDGRDISEKEYRTALINLQAAYRDGYYAWINGRRKLLSEKGTLFAVREQNKEDKLLEILSREAEYSLVLVFDAHDTLARHSLRRIMP